MAEKEVLFEDNMETQAQDFNNLQDWIGTSIDDIVVDAIDAGNAYTGLWISKAAATQVTIAPGRLYWGGAVYIMEDPIVIDFQTVAGGMPVTQQRQIAIVAWGSTITTDVQPRNFVVDADTGQAQPESVAMTQIRTCNVGPIPGVEAPSPNFPAVPATNLLIGYVLLNPSGVVSIQQSATTQLTNLTNLGNAVGALIAWQSVVNGQIVTLQSSLAALAAQLANYVTLDMFGKLADLVNQIWQIVNRPATFSLDTIDNFFDTSQSAVGTNVDGAYNALIAEGLRFASGGNTTLSPGLILPSGTDPVLQAWDTFVLPKPSGMRVRMDCSFPGLDWLAERILAHNRWTMSPRKLNWARERFRCGVPFLPAPSAQAFTWTGLLDPVYCNLRFDAGDTWPGVPCNTLVKYPTDDWDFPRFSNLRQLYYWNDYVDVFYWSKAYSTLSYAHNIYGQSFLNSQDGWLGGITVFSMVPAYYQPLTVLILRCDDQGVPDHQQCIGRIDLDAAAIQQCYTAPVQVGDIINETTTIIPGQVQTFTVQGGGGNTQQGVLGTQFAGGGGTGVEPFRGGQQVVTVVGDPTVFTQTYNTPVWAYPIRINFTPVYLEAGKRYSFQLLSVADHQFACSVDRSCYSVHQGDFWEYDGSYWFRVNNAPNPKTLRFMLHYLVWSQWGQQQSPTGQLRYDVELQPLSQGGGIAAVDVLAEHIIPPATDLSYAVMVNNNWIPFAGDPDNPKPLGASNNLVRFKMMFTGTSDVMPGVSLQNSQVKLVGPSTNGYYHISTSIPRGTGTGTGVKVMANVTGFTAHHTLTCAIHYGATHMVPNGTIPVTQTLMADGVTTQFTFNFAQAGISAYQVELTGGTDGTGDNFVVSQRASFSI
jgi:hypothetical protein